MAPASDRPEARVRRAAIYLDHNATAPLRPVAREAMLPFLGGDAGNPSSGHASGQRARRAVDRAREQVAALIHALPDEIVLTSGGTESDNLALTGCLPLDVRQAHVIVSAVEHQAVRATARSLAARGARVTELPVDGQGRVDPGAVPADAGSVVSVMLANNDVGTVQPVSELAAQARARGAVVHTDAVQAVGKIPVDVRALGVDLLSLSAHKLGGPQGVGALFVRRGVTLRPLLHGGHQERGRRAGTENVAGIVGFGAACQAAAAGLADEARRLLALRDRLEAGLLARLPWVRRVGGDAERLPGTSMVVLPGIDAEILLVTLDLLGVAASAGSACQTGSDEPSYVLLALGYGPADARSAVRFSLGPESTADEIDEAVARTAQAVDQLRGAGAG
jgi:cysteine desulfurase